jgi:septum formation protein
MEEIVLASTSPRRRDLLTQMGLPFSVTAPECDEKRIIQEEVPGDMGRECVQTGASARTETLVKKLASLKGRSVYWQLKGQPPLWIAGFDTLVDFNGSILGKAVSKKEAGQMLSLLSNKVHSVYTGIALYCRKTDNWDVRAAISEVKFAPLSREEINFYLSTGEWMGAAGSYRIQERGSLFIEWIKGSYSNIVGLPISLFYVMLKNNNYSFSLRQDN